MSRTIDQLAETGSSAPDDYLIKRSTATGADQRISVENFTAPFAARSGANDFDTMPQVNGAPIVESGSNSDGEWTRWADGTQECNRLLTDGTTNGVWTFPLPFIVTPDHYQSTALNVNGRWSTLHAPSQTSITSYIWDANGASTSWVSIRVSGRWK